jgi:tRNA-specific 2-thiouridylase
MSKKSVIVGMSGGVDSSVCAAILKSRGYRVIGMTMQLLDDAHASRCCNVSDVTDAKRVCAQLGIPHYTLNTKTLFKDSVIDPFIRSYLNGETPNPCVNCNRFIKFDALLEKANALGIDYVATGHYCKKTYSNKTKTYRLNQAADDQKDQTYFLYMLNQATLSRVLFPLGGYTKTEIRRIAQHHGLITANKKESQDICFVQNYKPFVEKHSDPADRKPGSIVDTTGRYLGDHQGLYLYTVGQRRGLNLGTEVPYYVIELDTDTNRVIVDTQPAMSVQTISLHTVSFMNPNEPIHAQTYSIKTRYQMPPILGTVQTYDPASATAVIQLNTPTHATANGQSLVLYDKNRVVGGGIIGSN